MYKNLTPNLYWDMQKKQVQNRQKGATLFVTVILVLVLSIVALAVYQQASFDERNARAQADRQLATQAAEIALRDAEYDLQCQQFSINAVGVPTVVACEKDGFVLNNVANAAATPGGNTDNMCRSTCIPGSSLKIDRLLLGFDVAGTDGLWAGLADSPGGIVHKKPWESRQMWATTSNSTVQIGRYTGAQAIPIVSQQPRYLIEGFIDSEKNLLFRITAKGWGRNNTTEVTLQQTYRP